MGKTIGSDMVLTFFYDQYGRPYAMNYNNLGFLWYMLNQQGDVVALIGYEGAIYATYQYDAWGNIIHQSSDNYATVNPLRYRGYVYDEETQLYYCNSRYYDPAVGRWINADNYTATGQGFIGNNMFAYCNNNPVNLIDSTGSAPVYARLEDNGGYAPNTKFLMAFYGVTSPRDIPEMPDGAMIFVENITSVSVYMGISIVEGRTIVMDKSKYCEYVFVGVGWSKSMSMPLDRCFTQGYVYGVENVDDYCGRFYGASGNFLSTAYGGAYASPEVYAEIIHGMSYSSSIGLSITTYATAQTDWIYGPANMVIVTNPYEQSYFNRQNVPLSL